MSTYYSLRCNTCHVTTRDEMNHGDDVLRDVLSMAPDLAAIRQKDTQGYIEIALMGHGSESLDFAIDHLGHEIVVVSEYDQIDQ